MAKNFQSIFDDCVEAEKQFDCMFGAEEDDKLIEAVLMMNEDAAQNDMKLPDEDELHQNDEESKPNDLRSELGPDHDTNKPTADSSDQEIIADDDDDILDLCCPKFGVQDAVQKNDPDNTDITDEIDKAEGKLSESLIDLLKEADTDLGDNDGLGEDKGLGEPGDLGQKTDADELTENEDKNENEEMKDPVDESTSLVDALLAECDDPEQSVGCEYTDPEDNQGKPSVDNSPKGEAEGEDDDPVYEDAEDVLDAAAGNNGSTKDPEQSVGAEYTDPEDNQGDPSVNNDPKGEAEGEDKDPVYESDDPTEDVDPAEDDLDDDDDEDSLVEALLKEEDEESKVSDPGNEKESDAPDEVEEESSLVEALLKEDDELPAEVEDKMIDDAEHSGEMSDKEVDAIDDVYDDDILDDLLGDED